MVRDLQSQGPGVSHPELFLPVPARTIIHPLILLSSQLLWSTWGDQVLLLQKYFCFVGGSGVHVFVGRSQILKGLQWNIIQP